MRRGCYVTSFSARVARWRHLEFWRNMTEQIWHLQSYITNKLLHICFYTITVNLKKLTFKNALKWATVLHHNLITHRVSHKNTHKICFLFIWSILWTRHIKVTYIWNKQHPEMSQQRQLFFAAQYSFRFFYVTVYLKPKISRTCSKRVSTVSL